MINWRREVCGAVRVHLVSHDDERLRLVQLDENHRVCDVSREQHGSVYFEHIVHTEAIILSFLSSTLEVMTSIFLVVVVSLFIRVLILMICHLNIWTTVR